MLFCFGMLVCTAVKHKFSCQLLEIALGGAFKVVLGVIWLFVILRQLFGWGLVSSQNGSKMSEKFQQMSANVST
jgi:hypothetical protein